MAGTDREEADDLVATLTELPPPGGTASVVRVVLDSIPDGIYLFDTDERLAVVNEPAAENSRFAREELVGRRYGDGATRRRYGPHGPRR